jgi:DNA-binding response OmpR family regulator
MKFCVGIQHFWVTAGKAKILIIEDDPMMQLGLSRILEEHGYEIFAAYDGVEGLQIATHEHPDLTILDLGLPIMEGYEILQRIKDRKIPTRIIIFSSHEYDIVRCIKAGACDFVVKGASHDRIISAIKRSLAVDSTIDITANDIPPLLEQLVALTEKLKVDLEKLKSEKVKLISDNESLLNQLQAKRNNQLFFMVMVRLLCLITAVLITIFLYSLNIISNTQALFLAPALFVLLLLPIEKIKKLSIKVPKAETGVEIEN